MVFVSKACPKWKYIKDINICYLFHSKLIIIIIMLQSHLMLNDYCNLGSISTLTKWFFFQKMIFKKIEIIVISITYYYLVIWIIKEIIQNIAYDNYYDFQHVNFKFSQIFIFLFWRLFNDKTTLKVRYQINVKKDKKNVVFKPRMLVIIKT